MNLGSSPLSIHLLFALSVPNFDSGKEEFVPYWIWMGGPDASTGPVATCIPERRGSPRSLSPTRRRRWPGALGPASSLQSSSSALLPRPSATSSPTPSHRSTRRALLVCSSARAPVPLHPPALLQRSVRRESIDQLSLALPSASQRWAMAAMPSHRNRGAMLGPELMWTWRASRAGEDMKIFPLRSSSRSRLENRLSFVLVFSVVLVVGRVLMCDLREMVGLLRLTKAKTTRMDRRCASSLSPGTHLLKVLSNTSKEFESPMNEEYTKLQEAYEMFCEVEDAHLHIFKDLLSQVEVEKKSWAIWTLQSTYRTGFHQIFSAGTLPCEAAFWLSSLSQYSLYSRPYILLQCVFCQQQSFDVWHFFSTKYTLCRKAYRWVFDIFLSYTFVNFFANALTRFSL